MKQATERASGARAREMARIARWIGILICLCAIAAPAVWAWSQTPPAAETAQAEETAKPDAAPEQVAEPASSEGANSLERSTPRATLRGFLEAAQQKDWELASRYMDFGSVRGPGGRGRGKEVSAAERADTARMLFVVLQRSVRLDLAGFSDDPEGDLADHSKPNLERVGTVQRQSERDFDVLLSRVRQGDEEIWLFSESTVAKVPDLYARRGYGLVEKLLPAYFFDVRFLTLELWQWIALAVLVVLSSALGWLGAFVLFRVLRLVLRARDGELRTEVLAALAGPLRLALSIGLFAAGTAFLHLSPAAADFFSTTCEILTLLAVTWFLLRCVDIGESILTRQLAHKDMYTARTLVPMGRRVTKVFVIAIALVSLIHNLGFSVTGILTTLGVGGLAVALAAQKPLENLFGAIAVIVDQPVKVGDFCRVGDHIGTVEDIGLRSTRIRTLDRTLLAIPNAEFATVRIENFAKRDRIWLHSTLQFGYDTTPDQMRYLLVEIRRMLYAHPKTHPDPCRVRFVNFGAYSLDVELFVYVLSTDFSEFLAIKEDIQLRIMDIVEGSGAYFAYPSQTLYLGRDPGRDLERSKAAEERVREWREQNAMPIPEFPPQEIRELDDTLAFPERGSSTPGAKSENDGGARGNGGGRSGRRR